MEKRTVRISTAFYVALATLVVAAGFILRSGWEHTPQLRAQENCTEVESFQGTGIQETPPFQVQSDTWRISYNWSSTNEDFGGIFQIYVHSAETDELATIISVEQPGSGESFVNEGAGSYYLNVNTAGAEWTVTVEDCEQRGGITPEKTPEKTLEKTPEKTPETPSKMIPKAGGPMKGPVPLTPNDTCPKEFPKKQDGACYSQ